MKFSKRPTPSGLSIAIAAAIASMAGPVHAQTSGDGALSDGNGAVASGDYSVAIGTAVTSAGPRSLSFGYASTAAGADSIVLGTSSTAQTNAVAVGNTTAAGTNATAMGSAATAAGNGSVAIGTGAVANNSQDVAIGSGSTTGAAHPLSSFGIAGENYSVAGSTSNGVVSFGAPQSPRQLTNVAAGAVSASSLDAVNGSELYQMGQAVGSLSTSTSQSVTSLSTAIANNATGVAAVSSGLATLSTTASQSLSSLSTGLSSNTANVTSLSSSAASSVGSLSTSVAGAGTALASLSTGIAQSATSLSTGLASNTGSITSLSSSTASGFGSLSTGLSDVGTTVGSLSTSTAAGFSSLSTSTAQTIGSLSTGTVSAIATLSTTTSRSISSLSTGLADDGATLSAMQSGLAAGTVGLVQQAGGAGTGAITIGASTGGTVLNVAGDAGARQVKGVAAGTDATDAVDLQQLQSLAGQTGAIGASAVSYDDASHTRVTLGASSSPVTLTNLADASLNASSTDAVTGRQLYAAQQATNANVGAIAALSTSTLAAASSLSTGIASNVVSIASLSTSTTTALSSLSTGLSSANAGVSALASSLANGTVGLVQQSGGAGTGTITIGASAGGTALDVGGTAGARQIKGVAAGTNATDAVNLQQLQGVTAAMGAVGAGAVSYDDPMHSRVTLGASAGSPVLLTNVADAALTATSTDAVSGRQLYTANQAISTYAASIATLSTSTGFAVSSLSSSVANGGATLAALQSGLAAGTIGLVQQAGGSGTSTITIGASTGGTALDIAGTAGARQVKGVAAGTDATDAVNLQQLQGVASQAGALGASAVVYDDASHTRVTLGTAGAPVTLTNVADAALTANSTDAVSGRQLYATNQSVSALAGQLATGTVGLVQQRGGSSAGAITIGATTGGTDIDVSGLAGARRISGVAAGVNTTDAVNVGQLNQVIGTVNTIAGNALSYDDPTKLSVTLGGLGAGAAVTIHNLAPGLLSATSADAVNGAQLFATNANVAANTSAIDALSSRLGAILPSRLSQSLPEPGQGSLKYAAFNSTGAGSVATGADATAIGSNAMAAGDRSAALGVGAVAQGSSSIAVGSAADATGANAVALGAGSVADRDDSVSIGNAATGMTRTLTNVSVGTAPTDAVNVQQLNDSVTNLSNRIEHDRRDANGGIAAAVAIASLPQAPAPGKSMVAIGGGTYGGQSAMALGISTYAGHWILKANGSTDTRGTVAAGVGAGFVW
ncbi:YadA-like family protein [Burkholderia sp. AU45388]|uniref:YadA-like family protein n=1 Tax=Burkholderia sp. AU45388 TaxID=3059206 RepID=UPI00264B37BC|nr:YadA-like family protein [Burkholderia sp. AU45388]MDN7430785.1 YadA-like family protein [Burkholderia sp. AU45388]